MLPALDLLPKPDIPVLLFTRHSLREVVRGIGLAGYDLQLTQQGRDLAYAWGEYLSLHSQRQISCCISSPIQRCLDTAELMILGAERGDAPQSAPLLIAEQALLVEPGSFVLDIQQAAPYFRQQGAVSFINSFVQNHLPGMKHPIVGVMDVLHLLYQTYQTGQLASGQLALAVSHDTILAAFIAVISGHFQVQEKDWPEMMEGLFVWFAAADVPLEQNVLYWIWRGRQHALDIAGLLRQHQQLMIE
jgi:hypothetical protein